MAERVIVGLSGGVDSSMAAFFLKEQGFNVECLFMKNWDDSYSEYCTTEEDYQDALQVAQTLNVPLHTVNFEKEYKEHVFEYFLSEYKSGRTPNPDIVCNNEIKFRAFIDHALDLGAEHIATGHYARITRENGKCKLYKGTDPQKDQSYFLYSLNQDQLSPTFFPIGEMIKIDIRAKAKKLGLLNYDKKDSTGICFIGEQGHFKDFLKEYLPPEPGPIKTVEGKECGHHDGLMFYTIGQRKGLGIGGGYGNNGKAWYVAEKVIENNELIVAQGHNHPALYSQKLIAEELKWISGVCPPIPAKLKAKTRYRQKDESCIVSNITNELAKVDFDNQLFAVTPGQSIVFYDGDQCLGGGIIKEQL